MYSYNALLWLTGRGLLDEDDDEVDDDDDDDDDDEDWPPDCCECVWSSDEAAKLRKVSWNFHKASRKPTELSSSLGCRRCSFSCCPKQNRLLLTQRHSTMMATKRRVYAGALLDLTLLPAILSVTTVVLQTETFILVRSPYRLEGDPTGLSIPPDPLDRIDKIGFFMLSHRSFFILLVVVMVFRCTLLCCRVFEIERSSGHGERAESREQREAQNNSKTPFSDYLVLQWFVWWVSGSFVCVSAAYGK